VDASSPSVAQAILAVADYVLTLELQLRAKGDPAADAKANQLGELHDKLLWAATEANDAAFRVLLNSPEAKATRTKLDEVTQQMEATARQLALDEQTFSRLVDFLTAIVNVIPVAGAALDVSALNGAVSTLLAFTG
jgi:hypothetical protein